MPGSTLQDFYDEMTILWNFKAWTSFRHDYMFLPDSELSKTEYLKKYNIELVDVYTDIIDEDGVDNLQSLYVKKRHYFKTIASCYSFSREDVVEMWMMNLCGNWLLQNLYPMFIDKHSVPYFGKTCFNVMSEFPEFRELCEEAADILNPETEPKNLKILKGKLRNDAVEEFLQRNKKIILNELFSELKEPMYEYG